MTRHTYGGGVSLFPKVVSKGGIYKGEKKKAKREAYLTPQGEVKTRIKRKSGVK